MWTIYYVDKNQICSRIIISWETKKERKKESEKERRRRRSRFAHQASNYTKLFVCDIPKRIQKLKNEWKDSNEWKTTKNQIDYGNWFKDSLYHHQRCLVVYGICITYKRYFISGCHTIRTNKWLPQRNKWKKKKKQKIMKKSGFFAKTNAEMMREKKI